MHGDLDTTVSPKSSELLHEWIENSQLITLKDFSHIEPVLVKKKGKKMMQEYAKFIKSL